MPQKLSNRLETVYSLIQGRYDSIYDLCCDHGHLGKSILKNLPDYFTHLYFVDRVSGITEKLAADIPKEGIVLNKDILNLNISASEKKLFLLCGVGGELCIKMLTKLMLGDHNWEIILAPHQNTSKLRLYLNKHKFNLISEKLVKENKQFYEILHIKPPSGGKHKDVTYHGDFIGVDKQIKHAYFSEQISYLNIVLSHKRDKQLEKLRKAYLDSLKIE